MQIWMIRALIILICYFLGLWFRKSRIMFGINTLLIIILCGGYCGNIDIPTYKIRYDMGFVSYSISEKLYDIIALQFRDIGFSFEIFHLIITIICMLIISYVIIKMAENISFVMANMLGFATIEYSIQIQSMCATAIIVYAVYYLINNSKKNRLKVNFVYSLLIIMACGFHFMSIFFLLFLSVSYINSKNLKYIIFIEFILILAFFPYINQLTGYSSAISAYLGNYRSPIFICVMVFFQIIGVVIIKKINDSMQSKELISINEKLRVNYIYSLSLILTLITPFYALTVLVNRIVRTMWVFYMITCDKLVNSYIKFNLNVIYLLLYNMTSFVLFYIILPDNLSKGVIFDILNNNIFF